MRLRATHLDPPRVGEQAPELDLPTTDGGRVSLVDLRGKASLLVFLRHAG